tara:strand:- start:93 stop:224 length:132 start_codon:yes stop_codon:yes gene_type:complete
MAYIIKYEKPSGETGEVSVANVNKIQEKLEEIGPCNVEIKEKE